MKHVLRRNPAPAPAIAAAAVAGMALSVATLANADTTTILVTSTPTATNLTSTGQALDSTFTFELGAFTGNFVPTIENVGEWLQYWTPVTDSSGTPLPTATVGYDDSAIPDTDPQLFMNSFTMEVILDHNNSPFLANTQAYIWGYNNRTTGGEWILIKEPAWQWGDNGQSPPGFDFFSMMLAMPLPSADATAT